MINIALLDDDKAALLIVKGALEESLKNKAIPFSIVAFNKPQSFLAEAKEKRYSLLFLDIDMPVMSGLEVGKRIQEITPGITIIFLSKREDLVFECLSLHPFGFIRKSQIIDDFKKVMELYLKSVYNQENSGIKVTITSKTGATSLNTSEIIYVEGSHNYQVFHLKDKSVLRLRILMNDLALRLKPYGFIRIQKGFLVNSIFIRKITTSEACLTDGHTLPISPKRKDDIVAEYLKITRDNKSIFFD